MENGKKKEKRKKKNHEERVAFCCCCSFRISLANGHSVSRHCPLRASASARRNCCALLERRPTFIRKPKAVGYRIHTHRPVKVISFYNCSLWSLHFIFSRTWCHPVDQMHLCSQLKRTDTRTHTCTRATVVSSRRTVASNERNSMHFLKPSLTGRAAEPTGRRRALVSESVSIQVGANSHLVCIHIVSNFQSK